MKKSTFFSLIFILSTFITYSQTEQQIMAEVYQTVETMKNNMSSFKKIEKIKNADGYKWVFLKEKDLQIVAVKQIEGAIEKNVEWYFKDGLLIYSETNWIDIKTKENTFNEKQYMSKGHLLVWVDDYNKFVDKKSDAFIKMDAELSAYGIKLKEEALK